MKQLSELLTATAVVQFVTAADPQIGALEYDSRKVKAGDCFFAVRGTQSDGHNYIASAIESGAVAVVCQELPQQLNDEVCYIVVEDSNKAMADMAAAFYDYPSEELELVELVERLAPAVLAAQGRQKVVSANVDLYSGMVYRMMGISAELYTPLFAMSRISGWCAHRLEEVFHPGGRIIRPAYKAVSPPADYLPLEAR